MQPQLSGLFRLRDEGKRSQTLERGDDGLLFEQAQRPGTLQILILFKDLFLIYI